ncbi:hypothetical protein L6164_003921 [Bauhinia variegata]|uniref:Uncharacterized protein n=1 Tax=Bauhinia variegata TaxID=167791 RepID=A0ACB9Q2V3_BAUVA|nr:hypothetical protein L6164_003921 [Bauhinia variegata]
MRDKCLVYPVGYKRWKFHIFWTLVKLLNSSRNFSSHGVQEIPKRLQIKQRKILNLPEILGQFLQLNEHRNQKLSNLVSDSTQIASLDTAVDHMPLSSTEFSQVVCPQWPQHLLASVLCLKKFMEILQNPPNELE